MKRSPLNRKTPINRGTKTMKRGKSFAKLRAERIAKAPGAGITDEDRAAIFERDGWKCLKCGSTEELTIDHVIPISKGGRNDPDNAQALCLNCNVQKGQGANDYRKTGPESPEGDI